MIRFVYPSSDSALWLIGVNNAWYGPFSNTGELDQSDIVWNAFEDTWDWSKGLYGDNNVTHHKVTGTVIYNPVYETASFNPSCTIDSSHCCKVRVQNERTLGFGTIEAHHGFNPSGFYKASTTFSTSLKKYLDTWVCWDTRLDLGYFKSWKVILPTTDYHRVQAWYHHGADNIKYNAVLKKFDYRAWTASWIDEGRHRRTDPLDITEESIRDLPARFGPRYAKYCVPSASNARVDAFRISGMGMSPKEAFDVVRKDFSEVELPPIEEEPHIYQSLVARCVNSVDYRKLNIYEFLQGFLHPQQMIPKLLNLKKLKLLEAVSGDYLTWIYGVLPTIHDLERIWDYFRAHENYYDRNGYVVFTAVETQSTTSDHGDQMITWRAKVAIDEEDPRYLDLRKQYDNLGRLPTLKEIWELIPFSFVIDWFVNVGKMLDGLQATGFAIRLPIRYYTLSKKVVTTSRNSNLCNGAVSYDLKRTTYHRWVTDHCPSVFVPPAFETTFLDRWIEGAALIIARKH